MGSVGTAKPWFDALDDLPIANGSAWALHAVAINLNRRQSAKV
jgi:hypothetical protein